MAPSYTETMIMTSVEDAANAVKEIRDTNQPPRALCDRAEKLLQEADIAVRSYSVRRPDLISRLMSLRRELQQLTMRRCAHPELPLSTPGKPQLPVEVVGDIDDMNDRLDRLSLSRNKSAGQDDRNKYSNSNTRERQEGGIGTNGTVDREGWRPSCVFPERRYYRLVRPREGSSAKAMGRQEGGDFDTRVDGRDHRVEEGHDVVGQQVLGSANTKDLREGEGGWRRKGHGYNVHSERNETTSDGRADEESRRYKPHKREPLRVTLPDLPAEVMAAAAAYSGNSRDSADSTVAQGGCQGDSDSDESITSPDFNPSDQSMRLR